MALIPRAQPPMLTLAQHASWKTHSFQVPLAWPPSKADSFASMSIVSTPPTGSDCSGRS